MTSTAISSRLYEKMKQFVKINAHYHFANVPPLAVIKFRDSFKKMIFVQFQLTCNELRRTRFNLLIASNFSDLE